MVLRQTISNEMVVAKANDIPEKRHLWAWNLTCCKFSLNWLHMGGLSDNCEPWDRKHRRQKTLYSKLPCDTKCTYVSKSCGGLLQQLSYCELHKQILKTLVWRKSSNLCFACLLKVDSNFCSSLAIFSSPRPKIKALNNLPDWNNLIRKKKTD